MLTLIRHQPLSVISSSMKEHWQDLLLPRARLGFTLGGGCTFSTLGCHAGMPSDNPSTPRGKNTGYARESA